MKILYIIFSIILCSNSIYSQDAASADSSSTTPLKDGGWAIQFRITNNLTLSSFNGTNISLKRHFTANQALRIAISSSSNSLDFKEKQFEDNTLASDNDVTTDQSEKRLSININPQFLYYIYPQRNPSIYIGIGPFFEIYNLKTENSRDYFMEDTLQYNETNSNDRDEYSIGITGLLGIEIFINDYLSLHAEYASSFYFNSRQYETSNHRVYANPNNNSRDQKRNYKGDGYYFSANSVLFGLSVYF